MAPTLSLNPFRGFRRLFVAAEIADTTPIQQAFDNGYLAWRQDCVLSDNPHLREDLRDAWNAGFLKGGSKRQNGSGVSTAQRQALIDSFVDSSSDQRC